jgi:hypothetical protein
MVPSIDISVDIASALRFVLQGAFYVMLFIFMVHALVLGYHWFTYGTSRHISLIALASYLSGGAVLFMTIAISLTLF